MIFLPTRHLENKLLVHAHGGTQKENTTNQMTLFSTIQLLVQNRSKTHIWTLQPLSNTWTDTTMRKHYSKYSMYGIFMYITCRLYRYYIHTRRKCGYPLEPSWDPGPFGYQTWPRSPPLDWTVAVGYLRRLRPRLGHRWGSQALKKLDGLSTFTMVEWPMA